PRTCSPRSSDEPAAATSPRTADATGRAAPDDAYVTVTPPWLSVAHRVVSCVILHPPLDEHDAAVAPRGRVCSVSSSHFDVAAGSFVPTINTPPTGIVPFCGPAAAAPSPVSWDNRPPGPVTLSRLSSWSACGSLAAIRPT